MKKLNFRRIFRVSKDFTKKHSAEILAGLGIAGMITTTVLAVKATPKAMKLMDEYKKEHEIEEMKVVETVKVAGPCYIPATILGLVSVGCIIGSSSIHIKRNAVLTTVYKLSENTLRDYSDKVVEVIGEKKEKEIRDAVAKDKINQIPAAERTVYVANGNTTIIEGISGRPLPPGIDIEKVRAARNKLNREMRDSLFVSLSDWYDEIGLPHTQISDEIGWNIDTNGYIDIITSACLDENEHPYLYIQYEKLPDYDHDIFG